MRGIAFNCADRRDPIPFNRDIAVKPRISRAIDDFTAANDKIVLSGGSVERETGEQSDESRQEMELALHWIAESVRQVQRL